MRVNHFCDDHVYYYDYDCISSYGYDFCDYVRHDYVHDGYYIYEIYYVHEYAHDYVCYYCDLNL